MSEKIFVKSFRIENIDSERFSKETDLAIDLRLFQYALEARLELQRGVTFESYGRYAFLHRTEIIEMIDAIAKTHGLASLVRRDGSWTAAAPAFDRWNTNVGAYMVWRAWIGTENDSREFDDEKILWVEYKERLAHATEPDEQGWTTSLTRDGEAMDVRYRNEG